MRLPCKLYTSIFVPACKFSSTMVLFIKRIGVGSPLLDELPRVEDDDVVLLEELPTIEEDEEERKEEDDGACAELLDGFTTVTPSITLKPVFAPLA